MFSINGTIRNQIIANINNGNFCIPDCDTRLAILNLDTKLIITNCHHVFHRMHLLNWMRSSSNCPICLMVIDKLVITTKTGINLMPYVGINFNAIVENRVICYHCHRATEHQENFAVTTCSHIFHTNNNPSCVNVCVRVTLGVWEGIICPCEERGRVIPTSITREGLESYNNNINLYEYRSIYQGRTVIMRYYDYIYNGQFEPLEWLIGIGGINFMYIDRTPLMSAVFYGNVSVVKRLLQIGNIDVNAYALMNNGMISTALSLAITNHNTVLINLLLDAGAWPLGRLTLEHFQLTQ